MSQADLACRNGLIQLAVEVLVANVDAVLRLPGADALVVSTRAKGGPLFLDAEAAVEVTRARLVALQ